MYLLLAVVMILSTVQSRVQDGHISSELRIVDHAVKYDHNNIKGIMYMQTYTGLLLGDFKTLK